MKYVSTRGAAPVLNFEEAMLTGLARDGGLYVPEAVPTFAVDEIAAMAGLSYEDTAFRVMRPFIGDEFSDAELTSAIRKAYQGFGHAARAPLVQLGPNHFLLELFHGPTLAFKDFAMQLIGQHGRVSDVQRRQMTTPVEKNVHALALDGDFDDCQAKLKDMFNDFEFRDAVGLAGVNSINWARVLAQVVYYFTSAVALGAPHRKVSFTVPTGNFGDIFAGYIAKQMGLPIEKLVIATNQNDILHRTMETGAYTKAGVTPSISPSMDIQVSSNFERALFDAYGRDGNAVAGQMTDLASGGFEISQGAYDFLKDHFASGRASEEETMATIKSTYDRTGEVLCPHSAVGVKVADDHLGATPMITLATAHPAKFPAAVKEASGRDAALPPRMSDLMNREERVTKVPNDLNTIEMLIHNVTGR